MKKDLYFFHHLLEFSEDWSLDVGWMKERQRSKGAISVLFSLPSLRSGSMKLNKKEI